MNNLPVLTPRLALVASLVHDNIKVVDIGTDHAYIPVWLTLTNKCSDCIAADIKKGPLGRAENTVLRYNANAVKLRLSNGLDDIMPSEADDIIIAGMGGVLILQIINKCEWLFDCNKHLVLQPMTAQEELRQGLYENGFEIIEEAVAKEGSKLYVVMSVCYCGIKYTPDKLFCITGKLIDSDDPLAKEYIASKREKLIKKVNGMRKAKIITEELNELEKTIKSLEFRV